MKTITRTLIILLAVAIVVAGTYAFSVTDWADELAQSGRHLDGGERDQILSFAEESGSSHRHGQNDGSGGGKGIHFDLDGTVNASTISQFLKTLAPFTFIIVVVTLVRKAYDTARRKRRISALQS